MKLLLLSLMLSVSFYLGTQYSRDFYSEAVRVSYRLGQQDLIIESLESEEIASQ